MDNFFEQKTLRENQELNKQVFKLNKQIKELQERVLTYEQMFSQLDEGIMSKLKALAGSILGNENMQRRKLPAPPQQTVRNKMNNPALKPLRLDDTLKVDPAPPSKPRRRRAGDLNLDDTLKVDPPFRKRKDDLDLDDKPIAESHTKAELQKIKNSRGGSVKLRGLVDKYKGKIEKAKTAAEKEHHRDEIATIRGMLGELYKPKQQGEQQKQDDPHRQKYSGPDERKPGHPTPDEKRRPLNRSGIEITPHPLGRKGGHELPPAGGPQSPIQEEQLLNEIGDTPMGQLALKLARARARARLAWDKGPETSFAKYLGKPGDMEKVIKDIGASERTIAQGNKRIKPTDTVSEGLLGSAMSALGRGVSRVATAAKQQVVDPNSALNKAVNNMPSNKTVARGLGDVLRGGARMMRDDRAAKRAGVRPNVRDANALDTATGVANNLARRLEADQRQKRAFPRNP